MRPARATPTAPRHLARYVCHPLEPRTLLDGDGEDPAVTINGTAGNDLIVIERAGPNMLVTVNGINHGVPPTVLTIRVNARGGNDEVRLDSTQRDVNIFGEGGGDRLVVTQPSGRLDDIAEASVTFDGGAEADVVQLWDDRVPAGSNFGYVVTADFIQRPGGASPVFSDAERVELRASGDGNLFSVRATSAGTELNLYGGAGTDNYLLGDVGNNLDVLAGVVLLIGDSGGDTVRLFDSANNRSDSWSVSENSVNRTGIGGVGFFDVGSVDIQAGAGNDRFDIESGRPSLSVRGGPGNEAFRLAPFWRNLDLFLTTVSLSGEDGIDSLSADDRHNVSPTAYVVDGQAIVRGPSNVVNHTGLESITLLGGSGNDAVTVPSTPIPLRVEGGDGEDAYTIGNGNLDAITATVTFSDGVGPGVERVTVEDAAATVGRNFQLVGGTLHVASMPMLIFNLDHLTINAGTADDDIHLNGTTAGPSFAVHAGAGGDFIFFSGTVANVTVDGQGGTDTLSVAPAHSAFYTLSPGFVDSGEGRLVTYAGVESVWLTDTPQANVITVTNTTASTDVLLNLGADDNLVRILETHPATDVSFLAANSNSTLEANLDDTGAANLTFLNSARFANMSLGTGARATLTTFAGPSRLEVAGGTLSIDAGATLDLAENELLHVYTGASPIATYRALLASGYAGGAWSGTGITSTAAAAAAPQYALGYAEFADVGGTTPGVLVRYTRYGDANLDRTVNLADFNRLAANFGQADRHWHQGNFNYDAAVNLSDFNLLAANFGQAVASRSSGDAEDSAANDLLA